LGGEERKNEERKGAFRMRKGERERFREERGIRMSEWGEEWGEGINRIGELEKGERGEARKGEMGKNRRVKVQ